MSGNNYLEYNKSVFYVLPMLHLKVNGLGIGRELKNVYIGIDTEPELNNHIFLHYKYSAKKEFIYLESQLMQRQNFVKDIHLGDDIMYVFSVPEIYKEDFKLFKEGKYSKFSYKYKMQILKAFELGYEDPLTGLYVIKSVLHSVKHANLIFPVINKLEPLKHIIEHNLSHFTDDLYFSTNKGYKLSEVRLGNQELYSIPDEREIFTYEVKKYPKSKIKLNKDFDNE